MNTKNVNSLKNAIDLFNKAITLDKKSITAYKLKGFALNNLNEYEQAIICFDLCIKYAGRNDHSFLSLIYANKGVSLMNLKEYKRALKYFDRSLEKNPQINIALVNRNIVLSKLKKIDLESVPNIRSSRLKPIVPTLDADLTKKSK